MREESYYQRRLIPVNIVVMILCLVAALSTMFAPFLQVDVGKAATVLSDMRGTPEDNAEKIWDQIFSAFDGVQLSVNTYTVWQFSSSEDIAEALTSKIAAVIQDATDSIVVEVAIPLILSEVDLSEYGVQEETLENIDAPLLYDKLRALETCDPGEEDEVIAAFTDELVSELQLEDVTEETLGSIQDAISALYDETVERSGGEFTLEAGICVSASLAMGSEEEDPPVYTTYEELVGSVVGSVGDAGVSSEEFEQTMSKIATIAKVSAYAMFFFAGVWLVLFVFALIHLFLPNKRFTMWYVKLFGFFPALLFFVPPLLAKSVLVGLEGAAVEQAIAILGTMSSMMWIGGLCYILLWLVSIFWAFPIKRKIRRSRKAA